jgi:hypothetical protein
LKLSDHCHVSDTDHEQFHQYKGYTLDLKLSDLAIYSNIFKYIARKKDREGV